MCYCFHCKDEQTFAPMGSSVPLNIWQLAANSRKRSKWFPDVHVLLITQCSLSPPQPGNLLPLTSAPSPRAGWQTTNCLFQASPSTHPVFAKILVIPLRLRVVKLHLVSPHPTIPLPCHTPFYGQTQEVKCLQLLASVACHVVQPNLEYSICRQLPLKLCQMILAKK